MIPANPLSPALTGTLSPSDWERPSPSRRRGRCGGTGGRGGLRHPPPPSQIALPTLVLNPDSRLTPAGAALVPEPAAFIPEAAGTVAEVAGLIHSPSGTSAATPFRAYMAPFLPVWIGAGHAALAPGP